MSDLYLQLLLWSYGLTQ